MFYLKKKERRKLRRKVGHKNIKVLVQGVFTNHMFTEIIQGL